MLRGSLKKTRLGLGVNVAGGVSVMRVEPERLGVNIAGGVSVMGVEPELPHATKTTMSTNLQFLILASDDGS